MKKILDKTGSGKTTCFIDSIYLISGKGYLSVVLSKREYEIIIIFDYNYIIVKKVGIKIKIITKNM